MILTQKTTKILGMIAIFVAVLIGIMLVIVPFVDQLTKNTADISAAEDEVAMMESQRDGYLKSKKDYGKIRTIDEDLLVRFPELADQNGIIAELSEGLSASGIDRRSLRFAFENPVIKAPEFTKPPAPAEGEGGEEAAPAEGDTAETPPAKTEVDTGAGQMATLKFTFSVQGSLPQLESFLSYMNETQRTIILKGYSLDEGKDGYILAGTAEAYIFAVISDPEAKDTQKAPEETEDVVVEETA